jgi:hypothetical protein
MMRYGLSPLKSSTTRAWRSGFRHRASPAFPNPYLERHPHADCAPPANALHSRRRVCSALSGDDRPHFPWPEVHHADRKAVPNGSGCNRQPADCFQVASRVEPILVNIRNLAAVASSAAAGRRRAGGGAATPADGCDAPGLAGARRPPPSVYLPQAASIPGVTDRMVNSALDSDVPAGRLSLRASSGLRSFRPDRSDDGEKSWAFVCHP